MTSHYTTLKYKNCEIKCVYVVLISKHLKLIILLKHPILKNACLLNKFIYEFLIYINHNMNSKVHYIPYLFFHYLIHYLYKKKQII